MIEPLETGLSKWENSSWTDRLGIILDIVMIIGMTLIPVGILVWYLVNHFPGIWITLFSSLAVIMYLMMCIGITLDSGRDHS